MADLWLSGCVPVAVDILGQATTPGGSQRHYRTAGPEISPNFCILVFAMWKRDSGPWFSHAIHIST